MLPTVEENRGYDFEDPENAEKWRGLFINSFRKVCERVQYVNDQNIGPINSVERHDLSIIFLNICNKTAVFTNVLYLFNVLRDIFFIFIIDFYTFFLLCSTGPSSSDIVIISYRTVLILRLTCKLRSGTKLYRSRMDFGLIQVSVYSKLCQCYSFLLMPFKKGK